MKLTEVYQNQSHQILREGWNDLTSEQKRYISSWERELWPLLEATLSTDQIQQLFTNVQQSAGRTSIGRAVDVAKIPVDVAKAVNAKINELGRRAQQAGPIKNADAKFEQLKKDIQEKNPDSKILAGVKAVSDWAKQNPGKASIAVGILTTIAAFAGGPAGGAAAGLVLRASKDLLQGEQLSTAVGKSVKTAAYGAMAGWAFETLGDWLEGLYVEEVAYDKQGMTQLNVNLQRTLDVPGFKVIDKIGSIVVPDDYVDLFKDDIVRARGGDSKAFADLLEYVREVKMSEVMQWVNAENDLAREAALMNDRFIGKLELANDAIAAMAQGSLQTGEDAIKPNDVTVENNIPQGVMVTESQMRNVALYIQLNEGPLDVLAKVGSALAKGAGKAAGAAKSAGQELTNKFTAKSLMKAWERAGKPTDSDEIADVLIDAGVPRDVVKSAYTASGIEAPKDKVVTLAKTIASDPKLKAAVLAALQAK